MLFALKFCCARGQVNDADWKYINCDGAAHSYMCLFPNFDERTPVAPTPMRNDLVLFDLTGRGFPDNPSGRVMPNEFFTFWETQWGGCGPYMQTDVDTRRLVGATSVAIGFR